MILNLREVARRIRDAFTYDPGHSDLDDEQPISISVTLGDWRKLDIALSETLDRMPTDAVIAAICKWMTWDYGDKAMRAEASELYHVIQNAAPQDAVSASAALPGHARTVAPNPAVAAPYSQQFDIEVLPPK